MTDETKYLTIHHDPPKSDIERGALYQNLMQQYQESAQRLLDSAKEFATAKARLATQVKAFELWRGATDEDGNAFASFQAWGAYVFDVHPTSVQFYDDVGRVLEATGIDWVSQGRARGIIERSNQYLRALGWDVRNGGLPEGLLPAAVFTAYEIGKKQVNQIIEPVAFAAALDVMKEVAETGAFSVNGESHRFTATNEGRELLSSAIGERMYHARTGAENALQGHVDVKSKWQRTLTFIAAELVNLDDGTIAIVLPDSYRAALDKMPPDVRITVFVPKGGAS